ncbi:hypothetical protein DPMN_092071 [Dreissena polymorpha]|uniref:Endonuclease/exonuclease/phosphatase domain-containing protein n=2 Tax=Dreissena polymorpha TaxID=45954 RepID=A0A9D4L0V4_DREPO|nr:hypothetical protein DPMN_092071 [Dreissena polymorpha]
MWHKDLDNLVGIVDTYSDRIAAIRICCGSISILILQVYLPAANRDIGSFKSAVDQLWDICTVHTESNYILIMGDFNARFPRPDVTTHLRSRDMYVTELAKSLHLYVATDTVSCTGPPFTFYPYNDANPSRIDHVLLDERLSHTVNCCGVIPDAPLNVSRHLPVFIGLSIDIRQDETCSSQALPRVTYR